MYLTSEQYKKAIYNTSLQSVVNIYIDNVLLNPKYLLDFKMGCDLFEDNLELGSVPSQYIEMQIHKRSGITKPKTIRIEYGILVNNALTVEEVNKMLVKDLNKMLVKSLVKKNNSFEIIPIGIYNIDDYNEEEDNIINIKALDNIINLDKDDGYYDASELINKKGYATLGEIAEDICKKKGLELLSSSFLNSDEQVSVYDNQLTAREYMSYIAEKAGGFCLANREGKIEFRKIGQNTAEIPLKLFKNYKFGDEQKITKVAYEDGVRSYKFGDETQNTLWIRQDNLFVTEENTIENIYNSVKGLTFNSFEGSVIIDPAIDIGDIIVIDGKPIIYQGEMSLNKRFIADIKSKINIKEKEETTVKKEKQSVINRRIQSEIDQTNGKLTQIVEQQEEGKQQLSKHEQTIEGFRDTVKKVETLDKKMQLTTNTGTTFPLTLENNSGKDLIRFEIEGNSVQYINEKNICPSQINYWEYGHYTTTGSKANYDNRIRLKELLPIKPGIYYFNTFNDDYNFVIRYYNADKTFRSSLGNVKNGQVVTVNSNQAYIGLSIFSPTNKTTDLAEYTELLNNLTLKPFICLDSESNKDFTPYDGISPDNPKLIYNVSTTNLLPTDTSKWEQGTLNSSTGMLVENNTRICLKDYLQVNENTKYICYVEKHRILNILFYDKDKNYINNWYSLLGVTNISMMQITTPINTKYIKITICKADNTNITPSEVSEIKPQMQLGNLPEEWTPYNTNILPLIATNHNMYDLPEMEWTTKGLTVSTKENHWTLNGTTTSEGFCCLNSTNGINSLPISYLTPGKYNFRFNYKGKITGKTQVQMLLYGKKANNSKTKFFDCQLLNDMNKNLTFTITENMLMLANIYVFKDSTLDIQIDLSITKAEENYELVTHAKRTKHNLDIGENFLGKVNDSADKFYIDNKGHGYIEKRVERLTINGRDNVYDAILNNSRNTIIFDIGLIEDNIINSKDYICNNFVVRDNDEDNEHIRLSYSEEEKGFIVYLYLKKTRLLNTSTINIAKNSCKTWLKTNPITIYYELETPKIVDLGLIPFPTYEDTGYIILNSSTNSNYGYVEYYTNSELTQNFLTTIDKEAILDITNEKITTAVSEINSELDKQDSKISSVEQKADSIDISVEAIQQEVDRVKETSAQIKVTTDEISSTVSSKVGKNEIVSSINQSAEGVKINGDKIDIEGQAVSFTTNVDSGYIYTSADITKALSFSVGELTPTSSDYDKYDVNGDGKIDSLDGYAISYAVNQNNGKIKGSFQINPYSAKKCITLTNHNNQVETTIGLYGIRANAIFSSHIYGNNIYKTVKGNNYLFNILGQQILYDNSSGSTGSITLNDYAYNYDYIEIFYKDTANSSPEHSVKVANPSGKNVVLQTINPGTNNARINGKRIYISGKSISYNDGIVLFSPGSEYYKTDEIKIVKVVGYK